MSRGVTFKKKRNNRIGMACVSIIVLAIFLIIMVRGVELRSRVLEYERMETALEKQITDEEKRTKELEEYEKYTKTDKYVEEIAKEKLGLVYEDEILFKSNVEE